MIVDGKNMVILYLEDWQKRMIKDFLGVECDRWDVPIEEAGCYIYSPPFPHETIEHKRMYLTSWQMRELRDELGLTCDFIELKKDSSNFCGMAPLYGIITPYGVLPQ